MLVWGTKGKLFKGDKVYMMSCGNCRQLEHVGYIAAKYFHIFWIPTIFWEKEIGAVCTHCSGCVEGDSLDPAIRKDIRSDLLPPVKRLAYFTGLFLIALCIALAVRENFAHKKIVQDYLAHPQVNDIYVLDMSDFVKMDKADTVRYGALRVAALRDGKQVLAQVSNFRSDRAERIAREVGTKKLQADADAFSSIAVAIPPADLQQMLDNGTIHDIVRN